MKKTVLAVSALLLWGGFTSYASATEVWSAKMSDVYADSTWYYGSWSTYKYSTSLEAEQGECRDAGPFGQYNVLLSVMDGTGDVYCRWSTANPFDYKQLSFDMRNAILENLCTLPDVYNQTDGTCGPPPPDPCLVDVGKAIDIAPTQSVYDAGQTNGYSVDGCGYTTSGISMCMASGTCFVTVVNTGITATGAESAVPTESIIDPQPTLNAPNTVTETKPTVLESDINPQESICDGANNCTQITTQTDTTNVGDTSDYYNDGTKATITVDENETTTKIETTTEIIYADGASTKRVTTTINHETGDVSESSFDYGTGETTTTNYPGQATTSTTDTTTTYDTTGVETGSTTETNEEPYNVADMPSPDGYTDIISGNSEILGYISGLNTPYSDSSITKPTFGLSFGTTGQCDNANYTFAVMGATFAPDFCTYIVIMQSVFYWLFAVMTAIYMFTTITALPRM